MNPTRLTPQPLPLLHPMEERAGERRRFCFGLPLSSVLSPLLRRGERKKMRVPKSMSKMRDPSSLYYGWEEAGIAAARRRERRERKDTKSSLRVFCAARRPDLDVLRGVCGLAGRVVARICNLPYRQVALGKPSETARISVSSDIPQNTFLQYGRAQLCAASVPSFPLFSGRKPPCPSVSSVVKEECFG